MSKDSVRPHSHGGPPPPDDPKTHMVAQLVEQLKRHLPIDSFNKLAKEVGQITVNKQDVPLALVAPHIAPSLFPIKTAEDLKQKLDQQIRRAVDLARSGAVSVNSKVLTDLLYATDSQPGKGSLPAPRRQYEFSIRMRSLVDEPDNSDKGGD